VGELNGRIHNKVQFCHHPECCMCHGRCKLTVINLLLAVCSVMIAERLHSYYEFFHIVQEVFWNRGIKTMQNGIL
jgi:hypothetical protein